MWDKLFQRKKSCKGTIIMGKMKVFKQKIPLKAKKNSIFLVYMHFFCTFVAGNSTIIKKLFI